MAILFNKVERVLPNNRTVKKWYASLKRITMVKEKQVARLIADETTLNAKEAELALSQLEKVLISQLLSGNSVQLGDWGSFSLTCNSTAHDTREAVTGRSIQRLNVRFSAGQNLKNALAQAEFKSADSL
ncbi:MAG: HU family DNA-binding protein [Prevotellaceae bacterium]|jgi:predicted histone-like DNA-binding protein|nr:HU family DNA-binding protein [Prevotellaceae bacterium]